MKNKTYRFAAVAAVLLAFCLVFMAPVVADESGTQIPLPTATVTQIENDELTFALNFKADEVTNEQLEYYSGWYADFVLTLNKDFTANTNGDADGYLSGQYDEWSENWVNVPFEAVTIEAEDSLKIMAYAAELLGQSGLKLTYNDVYSFVKDFDCGVFFEEDYLKDNPDLEVTLELRMYNPNDETESYVIGETYKFNLPSVAKIGEEEYKSLQAAVDAADDDETIVLLSNIEQADGVLITDKKLTINLDGNTFTVTEGSSTNNRNFKINGASEVTITGGTLIAQGTTEGTTSTGAYGTIHTEGTAKVTLTDLKLYNYRGNGLNIKALSGTTVTISNTEIYSQYGGGIEAAGGTVDLTDVKVEQKGMWTAPYNSMAISVNGGGTATVHSGTYTTECLTAEEANVQGTSHGPWAAGVCNSGGTLIINGGTFTNKNFGEATQATYARGLILADTGANIQINGGTFNALKAIIDTQNNLGDANNQPGALLGGGTFNADPTVASYSQFITLKEGYICLGPTEGKYTVEEANPEITVTPTDGVSSTLEVGYEQPTPQTITVENTGNVELTLTITKTGSDNITVSDLPESQTLAPSDSFEFTIQLDAGLAAGNYEGTITLSNESIENKVIPVSFTVSDPTSEEGVPGTTSPGSTSSSGKDTGSGNFQYYPRSVPADGIIDFGTSPVVTGMEVPVGSSGTVTLNTKPTFAMPENGFYIFEIDAPGYNTEAKINGGIAFKISIAKIEEAGWTENDVVLFHGTVAEDGKITWEALPTNLVKVENGIAYYKAAINGCSPFYIGFVEEGSIVNTEVVDPVTPPTEEPDVPGEILPEIPGVQDEPEEPSSPAPVLGLLAALGAAVVLRRK